MKARIWFNAMGQRDEARGVPYKRSAMQSWPLWAKRAYCAGRLAVPLATNAVRMQHVHMAADSGVAPVEDLALRVLVRRIENDIDRSILAASGIGAR